MKTEEVYEFIADSIDQIFDGEDVYDSSTTSKKEFREFLDTLTTKQFEKVQQFYATAPKLRHQFTVVNPKLEKTPTTQLRVYRVFSHSTLPE